MQTMTQRGLRLLVAREGTRLKAYQDSVGVWTIGVGHTSMAGPPKVTPTLTITAQEAQDILARDLLQYEAAVRQAIKVPLADHQFDALVSMCFNIGTGGFKGSTLVKRINAGASKADIRAAFLMWNKPKVIIGRRTQEADQYEAPYSPAVSGNALGSPVAPSKPSQAPIPQKPTKTAPEPPEAKQEGWLLNFLKRLF